MLLGIDHVVIAVSDLEAAIRNYQRLGFNVTRGGRHRVLGTVNALIAFADGAYLELLQFVEPDSAHPWYAKFRGGLALVDFCAQTDDLAGDVAQFRRLGVKISDPWPLSRERPDGYLLKWQLASPDADYLGILPFLIEDETPRQERVPRNRVHANQVSGIKRLTIVVDGLSNVAHFYEAMAGARVDRGKRSGVETASLRVVLGPHELEHLDAASPELAESATGHWLRQHGPSPYELTLTTAAGTPATLDPAITLGAHLRLE
jgi:catechol 2,3-dioxygenase-like lactoylglutathione lyase family enzyme